ncbi:Hypothetical protein R9X50_00377000 [Acrodontium crateriforme]|uniref:K Homology domain-containing protein n=1 Tax=Acrodontium crateriforme TaxID=150365 RepID=A0AAQ3R4I6_9PEZI|nr:Hypothetical protein R9X50_00377000 [Acrodontium crateriforme]
MADDREPRKRSRFDQTEPPRKSRFDQRSRSPRAADSDHTHRSRSPLSAPAAGGEKSDPAAAAAAAAARINAQLSARQPPQHADVPLARAPPTQSLSQPDGASSATLNVEIYQQDGDYIKDIEVNDLRNRYTLTKGSTQKMIKEETGAGPESLTHVQDVTTRGNYYPDKSMATAANPPLYLHVTSTSKDGLEKAVKKIEELMTQELPNLIDERRFRRREPTETVERDSLGRRKWPEERIPIDLEPIPGFNLRAQVVGAGGSYVKYIQQETHCRVQIKGRGSGYVEHDTNRESDESMYLHVAGPDPNEVQRAKAMCEELLSTVKDSYQSFKERPQRNGGGYGGGYGNDDRGNYRDRNSGGYGGSYNGGQHNQAAGGYSAGSGGAQSPTQASAQTTQTAQTMDPNDPAALAQYQAWAAYYAQNPSADPYAAYGGYAAMMAQYMQGAQQPQSQSPHPGTPQGGYYGAGQTVSPAQNGGAPPPPPPPPGDESSSVQPPPPPGSNSGYQSVPPPPGL